MAECFVIMQIGNPDLDEVCKHAIVPAIEACGLEPKRVDKHNTGGLLKSEIIGFIERAEIIIAELTNERPNCYLEIGYAMGIDKFRNLILTVREDHNPESPNYKSGGPKVHFDLSGYDILFWHPDDLGKFRDELAKRIKRRMAVQAKSAEEAYETPWNQEWLSTHIEDAWHGWDRAKKMGFMDIRFALDHPKPEKSRNELLEATRASEIKTFGWPIAPFMTRDEYKPRPRVDGIMAQILTDDLRYVYWAINRDSDFYLLKTIFEDDIGDRKKIFFNTRIVRVAETLLYCARLYANLNIDSKTFVNIRIAHGGLKDRVLAASNPNRLLFEQKICHENQIETEIRSTLSGLELDLVTIVKRITEPLFELFDFTEFDDAVYQDIVNSFVEGRVS
ncbi:MAG: hypothetical protein ACFE95_20495 [Candidatus Hodarchaeota archaeon]